MNRRTAAIAGVVLAIATIVAVAATTATATTVRSAAPAISDKTLIKCSKSATIGLAYPATGPAASLGAPQAHWANFWRSRWNRSHKLKINYVIGDTQLPNVAEATKVAQTFASTANMLAVIGPAGSQEVVASTPIYTGAGLGFVSGSATRTTLTDGSRAGFFFRVVPTDAQQGPTVATYAVKKLHVKKVVIIDDQETYSTGLAADAEASFKAQGVTVVRDSVSQQASDFSSLISRIGGDVDAVYIPWQLPPKAQLFAQQMREQGKRQTLLSSDGTFDPTTYKPGQAAYVSFFPVDTKSKLVKAYVKANGSPEFFGAPTYVAAQVVTQAVAKACKHGSATRAQVRKFIARTNLGTSLLGFRTHFTANGALATPGAFGIYKATNGNYVRVG